MIIKAEPLTAREFQPYGQVIEHEDSSTVTANQGTAKRRNWLATPENLRPKAKANFCTFRVKPAVLSKEGDFTMRLLERHKYSTQAFIPMTCRDNFLVIVCLNGQDDRPDLKMLRAFIAKPNQAINYHAGCWHHPIIALHSEIDFSCLVWEAGEPADCEEVFYQNDNQVIVHLNH